jgi:hypothetical protein
MLSVMVKFKSKAIKLESVNVSNTWFYLGQVKVLGHVKG